MLQGARRAARRPAYFFAIQKTAFTHSLLKWFEVQNFKSSSKRRLKSQARGGEPSRLGRLDRHQIEANIEAKIDAKIGPKIGPKIELKIGSKIEPKIEPKTLAK